MMLDISMQKNIVLLQIKCKYVTFAISMFKYYLFLAYYCITQDYHIEHPNVLH